MQNLFEFLFVDDWSMKISEFETLDEKIVWEIVKKSDFNPELGE